MSDRARHLLWIVTGGIGVALLAGVLWTARDDAVDVSHHLGGDPADMLRRTDGDIGRYRTEKAFPNLRFQRPLAIVAPPDGTNRLFVCEQNGVIYCFENERTARERTKVLDIAYKTYRRHNEEGLLGLAFHPQFADNGWIYIHYSCNNPRRGVVSRFTLKRDGNGEYTVADPDTEQVLLEQRQPWGNHNGGAVLFGPDGYLYLTFGDGGAGGDPLDSGQDLSTWLGSLLRIDVNREQNGKHYAIPPDNPFVDVPGAKPEIFAYGLRNLWRVTFDPTSGLMIGGDVGQNRLEEIDIIEKGKNYGWRAYEGTRKFAGPRRGRRHSGPYVMPIHEYGRSDGGSITGGYIYRGTRLRGLHGAYVYADYNSGNIWALRWDGEQATDNQLIAHHRAIASFGTDPQHELYLCSFDGYIHRLVATEEEPDQGRLPQKLSETGLFTKLAPLTPTDELVPYDVAVPLWSGGAAKRRWIRLPEGGTVTVADDGTLQFPPGTLFIKHFEMQMDARDPSSVRPLETRVTIVEPDERDALRGFTWVWNDEGTDALLLSGNARKVLVMTDGDGDRVDRQWHFPSRSECITCHTEAAGHVLGFRPEQLGREQLAKLAEAGVLADGTLATLGDVNRWPQWSVTDGSDDVRAIRAYLDVNCANCHQPEGGANASMDLRASTPLDRTGVMNVRPGQGNFDIQNARLVAPGDASRSVLLARMRTTGDGAMPNIGHTRPDDAAIRAIREWINSLPAASDDSEDF